ncbi:MAG: serine/threonine protein kinase/formylglycine-generating enzyme required for sulfatase activity [Planctomycetota bacterium]|jgi:serine/threonine protein kinase/formylglycine-generating enzyme required for sulfatase activity
MDWDKLYQIVDEARILGADAQEAFILAECGTDKELLQQVRLILSTPVEDDFLEPPEVGKLGIQIEGMLLGEFRVTGELARGGMGIVYRGVQEGLGRPVAIKVLPQIQRLRPLVFERFQREAAAASKVQHPHAVPVLSAGETQGVAWYAMPLIEGHDLGRELQLQKDGRTDTLWPAFGSANYVATAIRQVAGVAEALQHIHDLGILHRDIKPRNLLLSKDGQLSVVDFGLAKIDSEETLTGTSVIQGTPYYMSPEQARALRHPVDHRTDVYSLAVVLFELLCLRRPIDGDTPDVVLSRIASGTQISLRKANPRAPRDLVTICEKGMARNPAHRYGSAGELAEDLRRFIGLEAITARPTPLLRRAKRYARTHRKSVSVAALLVGMVVAWFAAASWQEKSSRRNSWDLAFQALTAEAPTLQQWRIGGEALRSFEAHGSRQGDRFDRSEEAKRAYDREAALRSDQVETYYDKGYGAGTLSLGSNNYDAPQDMGAILDGLRLALESTNAFPDHRGLENQAGVAAILPHLSIDLDPTSSPAALGQPATVYAQRMDSITGAHGPEIELGALPLQSFVIIPGEWRFTVRIQGVGFSEHDRHLSLFTKDVSISARVLETAQVIRTMTRIPVTGSSFPVYDKELEAPTSDWTHSNDPIPLLDYHITTYAISNRLFLEYVAATGDAPADSWDIASTRKFNGDWRSLPVEEVGERWLRLPVTGVPIRRMQACAEYFGMRLATHYEQEYADRGPAFLPYPWGFGPRPAGFLANDANADLPTFSNRPDLSQDEKNREVYRALIAVLLPVDEPGYDHAPFGLFHTFGNVTYATWSPVVNETDGRLVQTPDKRLAFGVSAIQRSRGFHQANHQACETSDSYYNENMGFRCVKSIP